MLDRRTFLAGATASGLAPTLPDDNRRTPSREDALAAAMLRPDTIAYHAAKKDLLFGTMVGRNFLSDSEYARAVGQECSILCATLISAAVSRRSKNGFNFALGDQQISFAKRNGLAVDGGYLVVHGDEPPWLRPDTDRSMALLEMQQIIKTTMTRYAGQLNHWIVVNEPLSQNGLRPCTWLSAIGPDYIGEAFRAARAASPKSTLVLNDNNLEGPDTDQKRATMLRLLTNLVNSGVPVDALGMQAHLRADRPTDQNKLDAFLKSVHDLGLKFVVTEMDVVDASLPADREIRDAAVAKSLGDFLAVLLPRPGIISISVWGLSDKYSWYNSTSTPAILRRSDNILSRGTLLDENLQRKPAYFAVRNAFDALARK